MAKRRHKKHQKIRKGISPNHQRKISEILLEFVQELAPLESKADVLEEATSLAAIIWNLPMLPPAMRNHIMTGLRQRLSSGHGLELQIQINDLLGTRQQRHGDDRRFIIDYWILRTSEGPRLEVASIDLDQEQNRSFLDGLASAAMDKFCP